MFTEAWNMIVRQVAVAVAVDLGAKVAAEKQIAQQLREANTGSKRRIQKKAVVSSNNVFSDLRKVCSKRD